MRVQVTAVTDDRCMRVADMKGERFRSVGIERFICVFMYFVCIQSNQIVAIVSVSFVLHSIGLLANAKWSLLRR